MLSFVSIYERCDAVDMSLYVVTSTFDTFSMIKTQKFINYDLIIDESDKTTVF